MNEEEKVCFVENENSHKNLKKTKRRGRRRKKERRDIQGKALHNERVSTLPLRTEQPGTDSSGACLESQGKQRHEGHKVKTSMGHERGKQTNNGHHTKGRERRRGKRGREGRRREKEREGGKGRERNRETEQRDRQQEGWGERALNGQ